MLSEFTTESNGQERSTEQRKQSEVDGGRGQEATKTLRFDGTDKTPVVNDVTAFWCPSSTVHTS